MFFVLKRVPRLSHRPHRQGACRAGQFLLLRLPIPGILAVHFPERPHRDERCSPVAHAPEPWRVGDDL
jgi:hypothetical protein